MLVSGGGFTVDAALLAGWPQRARRDHGLDRLRPLRARPTCAPPAWTATARPATAAARSPTSRWPARWPGCAASSGSTARCGRASGRSARRGRLRRVRGSVLGVIGLGNIGSLVAHDARALGMRVLATDPVASDEAFAAAGAERASLVELLEASDVVTLHAPHVRGAEPLLGRREVAALQARLDPRERRARRADRHRGADPRPRAGPPGLGVHGRLGQRAAAARRSPAGRARTSCSRRTRPGTRPNPRRRSTSASPRRANAVLRGDTARGLVT